MVSPVSSWTCPVPSVPREPLGIGLQTPTIPCGQRPFSLDSSYAPGGGSVRIQLTLDAIGRIREPIGALPIGKQTHNTVFLTWFKRRRGKLTHKKGLHLLLLHIVALALAHGR